MARTYLSSPERMSQAWIHPIVIVSVLSVFKIWFFTKSVNSTVNGLRVFADSTCQSFNTLWNESVILHAQMDSVIAAAVASLMEYAFVLVKMLCGMAISVASALVSFSVEIYLGTITCLCVALVHGAFECVVDVLRLLTDALQSAVNAVLKDFNSTLTGISSVINTAILGVDALKSLFGQSNLPSNTLNNAAQRVNLTLSSLTNVTLPTAYISKIEQFADEIPSFEDVLSNVTSLLTLPLHHLAEEVENVSTNFTIFSNSSTTNPSPLSKDAYLPLCLALDHMFDRALARANEVLKVTLISLSVATALLVAGSIALEYFKSRKEKKLFDNLAMETNAERIGNKILHFNLGLWAWLQRPLKTNQKWLFSYCFSRNIVNCFAIGAIGFLTVGLQFLILKVAKTELYQIQNSPESSQLLNLQRGISQTLVSELQKSVNTLVAGINDALFSSIQMASSDLLKNMLLFQSQANTSISSVFSKTPFAAPTRVIVYCTIGRKIEDIEDGLAWIGSNLKLPTPLISVALQRASGLSNSTSRVDLLRKIPPVTQSIWNSYQQAETDFIQSLKLEIIICSVFSGVWMLYIVVGVVIAWLRMQKDVDFPGVDKTISWPRRFEKDKYSKQYPHLDPLPHDSWSIFGD